MSTPDTYAKTSLAPCHFRYQDPPEDPDDKMSSFKRLAVTGNVRYLALHLGNPETTVVGGELYVSAAPVRNLAGVRYPNLLVAFGVDPERYEARNGYVISEQGKPPDFVLEVISSSSGYRDRVEKRGDYAQLRIGEYWRFDEQGRRRDERLAGDRLVDGEYVLIEIEELPDGSLQGYSPALDLYLRWVDGELVFHDPATGRRILTYEDQRARADTAEAERAVAEARVRELEEQLRRRQP